MSHEKSIPIDYKSEFDETDVSSEKINLETARQSWQRVHEIMCGIRPELGNADIEEIVNHLSICISFLKDVKGIGVTSSPESIRKEMTLGVYVGEFRDFIASRDELFNPEVSPPNDKIPCDLRVDSQVKMRFTFTKTTDRGFVSLDYDAELLYPFRGFYRGTWEQMQEKFTNLQNKAF